MSSSAPFAIRLATVADAAQCAAIYGPFCDTPVTFEIVAPTAEEFAARIERLSPRYPWLVAEHDGQIAGYVYACPYRERPAYVWSVDVAVYIHKGWRRHGVGRALYTSLFELLRLQGFYSAYAGITLPNEGSIGLHRSLGFTDVGVYRQAGYKSGAWQDVIWLGLALQPGQPDPPQPQSVAQARLNPAWEVAIGRGLSGYSR